MHVPANGIARTLSISTDGRGRNGKAERAAPSMVVDLLTASDVMARVVVMAGSHPVVPTLAEHLRRRYPGVDLVWHPNTIEPALATVARAEAHIAGLERLDGDGIEDDRSTVRKYLGPDARLVHVASMEHGLLVAPGNPHRITDATDLIGPGIRIVNQPERSISRTLLDRELRRAQIEPSRVDGYEIVVGSGASAADIVAAGLADCAVGNRGAAVARGLELQPLAHVRFDLVIPAIFADHLSVQALLETLRSPLFRLELEAFGHYDVSGLGRSSLAA
jgi:putative molybdopterin biosynthesis protein